MMEIPRIEISGNARERGRAHGEELRELIAKGIELWFDRLEDPQKTVDLLLANTAHLAAATAHTPHVVSEIRGIAEGAGVPFETLFAYNLADERQVFFNQARDSCTAAGVRAGAAGSPISGQTMDTPRWFDELKVVVESEERETGLSVLGFTVAGMVLLCGVNDAAVSVWCNAVYQLAGSSKGVPVACVARAVLSQRNLQDAVALIRRLPHASGQNYVIGSSEGISSLECSARSVSEARPSGNEVWHTNHPLVNLDAEDPRADSNSLARDAFAGRQLKRVSRVDDLQELLADRTTPVCKLGEGDAEYGYTLWAVTVEHSSPPRVYVSPGPPSHAAWREIRFSQATAGAS